MKPTTFPQANARYTAPAGMDDRCETLHACRVDGPGGGVIVSRWEPTDADRARIAAGLPVWLWVHADIQPPVSLVTTDPFGADPALDGRVQPCSWVPVGQLLPPPGETVLVATRFGLVLTTSYRPDAAGFWGEEPHDPVSHWMAFPYHPAVVAASDEG